MSPTPENPENKLNMDDDQSAQETEETELLTTPLKVPIFRESLYHYHL